MCMTGIIIISGFNDLKKKLFLLMYLKVVGYAECYLELSWNEVEEFTIIQRSLINLAVQRSQFQKQKGQGETNFVTNGYWEVIKRSQGERRAQVKDPMQFVKDF